MRGVDFTLSRLPAARAMIAGVAILVTAVAGRAHAQSTSPNDEAAYAIPRVTPHGASGIALPQPLPPSEAQRLRRIFALQSAGRLAEATTQTATIDATSPLGHALLGTILADRYLGRHTKPDAAALRAWLQSWPTLPDAPAIHALLITRLPKRETAPEAPTQAALEAPPAKPDAQALLAEDAEATTARAPRNPALERAVAEAARAGNLKTLTRLLAGPQSATTAELRGIAARILFAQNRDQDAYDIASQAASDGAATPGYLAGLAAWRLDRPAQALPLFEAAWAAPLASPAQRAAAAFWAARAHLVTHDPAGWYTWIDRAAAEPTSFHGLLAARMLGDTPNTSAIPRELLGEADIEAIAATEPGLRAFALLQIGQAARADAELRLLWPQAQSQPPLARAIMLVAERAGLVDLAAQIADLTSAAPSQSRARLPSLRPRGGFAADPALVYAIARAESNFDNASVSRAGASGLMQLMPATARAIGGESRAALRDAATNLDLGQRYLAYLAGLDGINGDLLHLLAAYNAGPSGFARRSANLQDRGDPLLFLESIPADETRAFIPRVLAYTWRYAARLHLPAASLDELAAGLWPRYTPADAALAAN